MLDDILKERKKKLDLYEKKTYAFPASVLPREKISDVLGEFKKPATVSGRVFSFRDQGGILFFDIKDESGKIQIIANKEDLGDFEFIKSVLDIGDIVEISGSPFETKRGEKSLKVESFRILSKSLRPIPSEWYGIEDVELRFRKRYLDFLMNPDLREMIRKKSHFWGVVREFLKNDDFLEVETPVLESIPGGAEAEPFKTHHNTLDEDFYLRISLELPLKKILIGGFEKVFEIGRIFRNEGIDREHLQDYTQMECYAAYCDYEWMMSKMQELYKKVVGELFGDSKTVWQGQKIQWGKNWDKIDYFEIFRRETGIDLSKSKLADLEKKIKELGISYKGYAGEGRLIDLIFKKAIRPKLIQPCFLINPPVLIEPLAKRLDNDKTRVYRFQIIACGTELGKGFSELNDPRDQRIRFEEQMELRKKGDKEAQLIDENFIEALEYGMPPAAGFGMSERFFAVIMDKPIRETTLFPLLRKE